MRRSCMRLVSRLFGTVKLIAVVLAVIAVIACGGDDDDDTNPTTAAGTSTISTNAPTVVTTGTSDVSPTRIPESPTPSSTPTNTATPTATPTPTLTPTLENTPPLVVLASNGGPLGGTASVTIQTKVAANCSIVFVLPGGTPTNVPGLDPQVADATGKITWTWTLDPAYPTGSAQAQVTCERSRRAAIIEITP
jgi:hypothetical protein